MNMIFCFTFVWDKQTFLKTIPLVIVPGGMKKFNYSASKHQASYFLWICRHHFQHGCYFQILLLLSPFLCAESPHCVKMSTLQLSFLFAVEDKVAGSQIWQAVWMSDYCVGVAKKNLSLFCVLVHNDTVTNPTVHMLFFRHLRTLRVWPKEINLQRTIPKISKLKKEK